MKVVLVNLSNEIFTESRHRLNHSAQNFGILNIVSYDFEELKTTQFYTENIYILQQPRGIGFWAWKPYIILEAMHKLEKNDIVVYADSGIEIIADLTPILDISKNGPSVLLFANGDFVNAHWTKRDCFIEMGCDSKEYWYGRQVDAAFSIFKKSDLSIQFLEEWLFYCKNENVLTDLPNIHGKKNIPGFIQHRWDQSVLSLLAIKYKLELYRMPTQFGNHYKAPSFRIAGEFNCKNQLVQEQLSFYAKHYFENSPYFQLLDHHRRKHINVSPAAATSNFSNKSLRRFIKKRVGRLAGWMHNIFYK